MHAHRLHDLEDVTDEDSKSETKSTNSKRKSAAIKTSTDQTMLNYVLIRQTPEDVGGMFWTWRMLLTQRLFDTEGIWLPTRLVVVQGTLFIFFIIMALVLNAVTNIVAQQALNAEANMDPTLPDWVQKYVLFIVRARS